MASTSSDDGITAELPLCDVLVNPSAYAGRIIKVRGELVVAPETSFLWDHSCQTDGRILIELPEEVKPEPDFSEIAEFAPLNDPLTFARTFFLDKSSLRFDWQPFPRSMRVTLRKDREWKLMKKYLNSPNHSVTAAVIGRFDWIPGNGIALRMRSGEVSYISGFGHMNAWKERIIIAGVRNVEATKLNAKEKK
jgi:hypothetical protein